MSCRFGFSLCLNPKCGTTLTRFLLRRMMGFKNWRSRQNGLPHNDDISGLDVIPEVKESSVKVR